MAESLQFSLGNHAIKDPRTVLSHLDDLAKQSAKEEKKASACYSFPPQLLECLINKKCIAFGNEKLLGEKIKKNVEGIFPGWKLYRGRSEHTDRGSLDLNLSKDGVNLKFFIVFVIAKSSLEGIVKDCGNILKYSFG
jgi:hypothetical protein